MTTARTSTEEKEPEDSQKTEVCQGRGWTHLGGAEIKAEKVSEPAGLGLYILVNSDNEQDLNHYVTATAWHVGYVNMTPQNANSLFRTVTRCQNLTLPSSRLLIEELWPARLYHSIEALRDSRSTVFTAATILRIVWFWITYPRSPATTVRLMISWAPSRRALETMNRGPSPIFDVPEFPTLRRMKPLPKRRRTSATTPSDGDDAAASLATLGLPFHEPGPDATAEDLIAHAESLSAHMALQSYYVPGLDVFNQSGGAAAMNGSYTEEDGEDGDDDSMEHLQQPGNTKKRKVPATHASPSPTGHERDAEDMALSGGEEEEREGRSAPVARTSSDDGGGAVDVYQPPSGSPFAGLGIRKGRPPPITHAGLQHKEILKSRKRQLAAVLGAISHGDTLALDQALSVNYPFITATGLENPPPPRVRISRRFAPRLARAARFSEKFRHPDKRPFLECEFTFAVPSSTADRLIATKEEVAMLRGRFEAELAKQAAKAAKYAAANKLMSSLPASGKSKKRGSRAQSSRVSRSANYSTNSALTTTTNTSAASQKTNGDMDSGLDSASALLGLGAPPKPRGKKKKRSALANASNPHHLRNYVPSRLPHSSPAHNASGNAPNGAAPPTSGAFGPLPLRFLSADIPPRRRRGGAKQAAAAQPAGEGVVLNNPAEEWICAYCEYNLFYGDETQHRRAVRSRKKILKRRRRARERAARAASGKGRSAFKGKENKEGEEEYEMHPGWAPGAPTDPLGDVPKQTKWRGGTGADQEHGRAELGAG
ncbi:hypothetical protein R3P38DRAFT_2774186 [Favolaschia claudopus]|uniref:Uncharacterized protein n=1 Tax=Favolaschia claudopus TaxID=2862362 RepID=A0AAW0BZH5_9AGAR